MLAVSFCNGTRLLETNMENLKGVESTWEITDKGLKDGSEQTVYDFCVSDTAVDGSKVFL